MGKSSAKRSVCAQACAQGDGEIKCKKVSAHRRAHRVMGKSSTKRSVRAQACAQGDGEIKCKKVSAHTGARTG